MDWLGQNWIWILAAIAIFALFSRGHFGGRGGHGAHGGGLFGGGILGGGHGGHGGGLFGGGHSGGHGGHGDGRSEGGRPADPPRGAAPAAAIDPVSGNAVRTDRAVTAVHKGRVFYFETAETRQRFESEPDKYAANAPADDAASAAPQRPRRRGC